MCFNKELGLVQKRTPMVMQTFIIRLLFLVLILTLFSTTKAFGQEEEVLKELHETLLLAPVYDEEKLRSINSLRDELSETRVGDLNRRYELNRALFNEYRIFKQDSAFAYGLQTKVLAEQLDDLPKQAEAIVNLADVSVSAGMYKEALDFLDTIDPDEIPPYIRSLYYGLLGRCYNEMAEYSNLPYFSSEYNQLSSSYRQTALELTEEGTFFNSFLEGFIEYKHGSLDLAIKDFRTLLQQEMSLREEALVHYSLGDIYHQLGEIDQAIVHFAKAAIADIKTSTKETLAMIRLAELLFAKGEVDTASVYIQKANDDAGFYGAQQRKIRVGAILPLIEEEIVQKIEEQRERLYRQNLAVSLLLLFVIGLAVVIYLQVTRLRKTKRALVVAHEALQETNQQVVKINDEVKLKNKELNNLNVQLLEANRIKEEYIGFFFTQDADIFEKFRDFKTKVEKGLQDENLDKLRYLISSYDLKKEKKKLLKNFDEAFIKLFPNFIEEFNSLLKPEEQINVKKGQILNKELRIFALMRLGISHNEIIAQILGYSVNSIYAYKTKIRKKSRFEKKDFDQKLVERTTLKQ